MGGIKKKYSYCEINVTFIDSSRASRLKRMFCLVFKKKKKQKKCKALQMMKKKENRLKFNQEKFRFELAILMIFVNKQWNWVIHSFSR